MAFRGEDLIRNKTVIKGKITLQIQNIRPRPALYIFHYLR
jgi:hypothetical protein